MSLFGIRKLLFSAVSTSNGGFRHGPTLQKRSHPVVDSNDSVPLSLSRYEKENFHVQSVSAPNEKLVAGGRSNNYQQGIASQANFCSSLPSIPTANSGFARSQGFQSMTVLNTNTPVTADNSSNKYNMSDRSYIYQQNLPVNQYPENSHNFAHAPNPHQNIGRQYVKQSYTDTSNNRSTNLSSGQPSSDNGSYYNLSEATNKPQFSSNITPVYVSNIRQSASLSALTEEPTRVEPSYSVYSIPREIDSGQVGSSQMQGNIGHSQESLNNIGLSNLDISVDRKGDFIYQVYYFARLPFHLLLTLHLNFKKFV